MPAPSNGSPLEPRAQIEGRLLVGEDEEPHTVGPEPNWNESRYVDVLDRGQGVGAWLRLGNRPNEGRAEMTVALALPDGRSAFMFDRAPISGNGLAAGGQRWAVPHPYRTGTVAFEGEVLLLDDGWDLTDPKRAFTTAPRATCTIDLTSTGAGLQSVMGADQAHIDRIFLPGQAAWHYQHLVRSVGTIRVGDQVWDVDGHGGRDHSWGPRNWHAKIFMRWLIAGIDDDLGFMLTRAVGPTKQTRSGFVWDAGAFHIVDDFSLRNTYAGAPHHEIQAVEVSIRSGTRTWRASGAPSSWIPLRHVQTDPDGGRSVLRIVKSPAVWTVDGRLGEGMLEYHDRLVDGRPVGQPE